MKIGVLQADTVSEEFQADHGNYPTMFENMLKSAGKQVLGSAIEVAHYNIMQSQFPKKLNECDAYIITGSKKSVYDDEPWIHKFRGFLVELNDAKKIVIGICFGHQLIADALGGKTELAKGGWGVGVHQSTITNKKKFMNPPLDYFSVIVSHQDQVAELPSDAERLAASEFCPNAMFQIGKHILTFQGHPEFTKGYSRALLESRKDIIGDLIYELGCASLKIELHSEILAQWIIRFINNE
jgi:GMP synthase-like glutamine amidotransferase